MQTCKFSKENSLRNGHRPNIKKKYVYSSVKPSGTNIQAILVKLIQTRETLGVDSNLLAKETGTGRIWFFSLSYFYILLGLLFARWNRLLNRRAEPSPLIFMETFKISLSMMCNLMEGVDDDILNKVLRRDLVGCVCISKAHHNG